MHTENVTVLIGIHFQYIYRIVLDFHGSEFLRIAVFEDFVEIIS